MDPAMLSGMEIAELREVAKRLDRSLEGVKHALNDLEQERGELQDEKTHLDSTIQLVMQDLRKLNIGGGNLAEPKLDEGPVEFIGRWWERVKPRDTAYTTSEHVGEIRKPSYTPDGNPNLSRQVAQHGHELRRQFSDHVSFFKNVIGQAAGGSPPSNQADPSPNSMGQLFSYLRTPGGMPEVGPDSSGPGADDAAPESQSGNVGAAAKSGSASESTCTNSEASSKTASRESRGVSREPSEEVAGAATHLEPANTGTCVEKLSPAIDVDTSGGAEVKTDASTNAAPAVPEAAVEKVEVEVEPPQPESSLLIEVQFTLGDGSVAAAKVHASDRCKEVATRFVQDNSLKKAFEAPVKAYLMEAESNAVTFPVRLEADLMEICEQYAAKK